MSIGQLCDAGCIAAFTASHVTIKYLNEIILKGNRDPITKLWKISIPISPAVVPAPALTSNQHTAATTINHPKGIAQLVAFAHASLFSPALSTLQRALDLGYLNEIPGLTPTTIRKHPPLSVATVKGHLDQVRKNLRPTSEKQDHELPLLPISDEHDPTVDQDWAPDPISERTHACYATCIQKPSNGHTYSDQTGRFPTTSSQGNTQLFVLYDYDSNSIHAVPMATRKATEILHYFKKVNELLIQ